MGALALQTFTYAHEGSKLDRWMPMMACRSLEIKVQNRKWKILNTEIQQLVRSKTRKGGSSWRKFDSGFHSCHGGANRT